MYKQCPVCKAVIQKVSNQFSNQRYCTTNCRKKAHRKKKVEISRSDRKRANLLQNDEMVYLINQCKKAGTVQILHGHDLQTFVETMDLLRTRPKGDVHLCHIAPSKGKTSVGLFHCKNLFYGGAYQNRKFGNRYISGGLFLEKTQLISKWKIKPGATSFDVLMLIEKYMGGVIDEYLEIAPVRKSNKVGAIEKIMELDKSMKFDDLIIHSKTKLREILAKLTRYRVFIWGVTEESKYLAYMDGLERFISYGGRRAGKLVALQKLMVVAYMALQRVQESRTYNKYFYVKYELLIDPKYAHARLKYPDSWSTFKDLIYETAFYTLQGDKLDVNEFKRKVFSQLDFTGSYLETYKLAYADSFN